jgi:hypothetical protein
MFLIGGTVGIFIASILFSAARTELQRLYLQEIYKLSEDKRNGKK